jgi:hypothetical protein
VVQLQAAEDAAEREAERKVLEDPRNIHKPASVFVSSLHTHNSNANQDTHS